MTMTSPATLNLSEARWEHMLGASTGRVDLKKYQILTGSAASKKRRKKVAIASSMKCDDMEDRGVYVCVCVSVWIRIVTKSAQVILFVSDSMV